MALSARAGPQAAAGGKLLLTTPCNAAGQWYDAAPLALAGALHRCLQQLCTQTRSPAPRLRRLEKQRNTSPALPPCLYPPCHLPPVLPFGFSIPLTHAPATLMAMAWPAALPAVAATAGSTCLLLCCALPASAHSACRAVMCCLPSCLPPPRTPSMGAMPPACLPVTLCSTTHTPCLHTHTATPAASPSWACAVSGALAPRTRRMALGGRRGRGREKAHLPHLLCKLSHPPPAEDAVRTEWAVAVDRRTWSPCRAVAFSMPPLANLHCAPAAPHTARAPAIHHCSAPSPPSTSSAATFLLACTCLCLPATVTLPHLPATCATWDRRAGGGTESLPLQAGVSVGAGQGGAAGRRAKTHPAYHLGRRGHFPWGRREGTFAQHSLLAPRHLPPAACLLACLTLPLCLRDGACRTAGRATRRLRGGIAGRRARGRRGGGDACGVLGRT